MIERGMGKERCLPLCALHQWGYFSVRFSLTLHGGVDIINTSRKDDFIDFEERRAAMALQAARKEAVSDKRC